MELMKTELNYFKFLIKQNRRLIGLYSLILLATFPLLIYFFNSYATYALYTFALVGQTLNLVVTLLASIIIPLTLFKYTSSKKSLDVYDALPLQKETMFRVNYMVGLLILIIPFILSWLIGIVYLNHVWPGVLDVVGSSSYLSEAEFFNLTTQLKHLIEIIPPLALCYTMSVMVKQNTGSIVDAAIYSIIIHVIPMLAYWSFYAYCNASILGFADEWSAEIFQILAPLTAPFVVIYSEMTSFVSLPKMAYYTVCTVVLFIFSSYLYVNHKSERCEQPFTTKYFFPLISNSAAIILLILLFSTMDVDVFSIFNGSIQVIYPILLCLIAYLLLDVIAHRGFKNIFKACIKYLIVTAVALALLAPIELTNGFGYVTHIPEIQEIESIEIDLPYFISELYGTNGLTLTIETEENIQKVVEYHEHLLNHYAEYDYNDNAVIYSEAVSDYPYDMYATLNYVVTIRYNTTDGEIIRRYNRVPMKWTKALLELKNNEDIINARLAPSSITQYLDDPNYRVLCTYIEYTDQFNQYVVVSETQPEIKIDIETFLDVYHKDLENRKGTYDYELTTAPYMNLYLRLEAIVADTLLESSSDPIHTVELDGRYYSIEVSDVNTIAYLNSIGITPSNTINEGAINQAYLIHSSDSNPTSVFHSLRPLDDFYRFDLNIDYYELTHDDVVALSPYLRTNAVYDEPGYILCVDTHEFGELFYIISNEHKNILEGIIKDKQRNQITSRVFRETYLLNGKY